MHVSLPTSSRTATCLSFLWANSEGRSSERFSVLNLICIPSVLLAPDVAGRLMEAFRTHTGTCRTHTQSASSHVSGLPFSPICPMNTASAELRAPKDVVLLACSSTLPGIRSRNWGIHECPAFCGTKCGRLSVVSCPSRRLPGNRSPRRRRFHRLLHKPLHRAWRRGP
ncbi:hypothetical protein FB451DRAFT_299776 [Mycena latifolia]|nr:hypothetical protein FB451DRAFT_299776 [Mycena latifolia]